MPSHKRRKGDSDSADEPTEKVLKKGDDRLEATKNLYWSFDNPAVLGRGSFGNVQIWFHHSKGILCAAKSFKSDADFRYELEHVRNIEHENVIRCLGSYENQRVILYNLCTTTLKEMIEEDTKNHFGVGELMLRFLIKHMVSAQDHLVNKLRIIHRDIKPANILYDDRARLFILTDFGLAIRYDPENMTYTDRSVKGTPDFMRPDLIAKLAVRPTDEQLELSIASEIWSLAVTIFVAATGRHPFKTKIRSKGFEMARDRPVGSFWVDKNETYMYELRGYNRLSSGFQVDALSPLLAYMMSSDADFAGLFTFVDRRMLDRDILFVFDVNAFSFRKLPCTIGRDSLMNVLSAANLNCEDNALVYTEAFVPEGKSVIPRTTEDSPVIVCSKRPASISKADIKRDTFGASLDFFDEVRVRFYENDVRCIFENVVDVTNFCQRRMDFVSSFAKTVDAGLRKLQSQLTCIAECFEMDSQELFRLHRPSEEFSDLISSMRLRTGEALLPVAILERVSVRENEDVKSFDQHLTYLKQRKFSANRKEHVLQVKKSMDLLCDAIADAVERFVSRFVEWYEKAKTREEVLKRLLTETQFARKEIIKNVVSEIEAVGISSSSAVCPSPPPRLQSETKT